MARRIYEYQYGTCDTGSTPYYELRCIWGPDDLEYLAEEAAEDYFNNHDGWESSWPLTFTIFQDEKKIGQIVVDMETVPRFHAHRPQSKSDTESGDA